MKKLLLPILCFVFAFAAKAQLAGITLVSPNPLPTTLNPGQAYNLVFKYEYFPVSSTGVDASSITPVISSGTATAVLGPVIGQYFSITLTCTAGPVVLGITANAIGNPTASVATYVANAIQLPITLTRFDAVSNTKSVNLSWSTATEENNAFYTIERSFDGKNYDAVGQINGGGTTKEIANYTFEDKTVYQLAAANVAYYRLKQTDRDGLSSVYAPVAVKLTSKGSASITSVIAENVLFDMPTDTDVTITIFDLSGKQVASRKVAATAGFNKVEMDFSAVQNGLFIVSINNGETITTKKIVR